MNPHDDPRELLRMKNADNQKRSCHNLPRRDEEHEQWHTRRAQRGVLKHESIQRATAKEQAGVIEYKSIQRATERLDPERREEENEKQHTRQKQQGVLGYKSIQHATARLDPAKREEYQSSNTSKCAMVFQWCVTILCYQSVTRWCNEML